MSSKARTVLVIAACVALVLVVWGIFGRSRQGDQLDSDQYRPNAEGLRKMNANLPTGATPYGQPPKPGEVRTPPPNTGY